TDNDYTYEEMKMTKETKKIMEDDSIAVSATCVRIPVLSAHSESVYIETKEVAPIEEVKAAIAAFPGAVLEDDVALKECKIITAFITPFHEDGSINFDAIPALIEHLLAHHTDGILLAGTTAESPTLTHDEELELFAAVQKVVNGRVPLIAGVGTNDTRDSIEFVKEVAEFGGFAAGLAIVPYYNKPSQEGMYQHFKAIADASDLPIIIYNIPGRVVVELTPETMLRLADHPNIIGVKECTSLANMA
ncbi:4-hydroxy-tetrahydrodipicolinate synthase family protein, partial [Streptococcus pneumoniae]|uniref:4-hydroxy-tetrahydrodipicolinate synthase family protein n=1 Tax=Streptococcus pneumoniae TaxID=1313 RepID=UPI001885A649